MLRGDGQVELTTKELLEFSETGHIDIFRTRIIFNQDDQKDPESFIEDMIKNSWKENKNQLKVRALLLVNYYFNVGVEDKVTILGNLIKKFYNSSEDLGKNAGSIRFPFILTIFAELVLDKNKTSQEDLEKIMEKPSILNFMKINLEYDIRRNSDGILSVVKLQHLQGRFHRTPKHSIFAHDRSLSDSDSKSDTFSESEVLSYSSDSDSDSESETSSPRLTWTF